MPEADFLPRRASPQILDGDIGEPLGLAVTPRYPIHRLPLPFTRSEMVRGNHPGNKIARLVVLPRVATGCDKQQ